MFMLMETGTRPWTLAEVHRLPDDGNKYELVHGELFVTPAPTNLHETVLARLTRILEPYVARHSLGFIYRPRAVLRIADEVEVEPDLMVRQPHPDPSGSWETAPRPAMIVEVLSPITRRRDLGPKRAVYRDEVLIPDYWIIDPRDMHVRVVGPGEEDVVVRDWLTWSPAGPDAPLEFRIALLFGDG